MPQQINHADVDSSSIRSIGYDEDTRELHIAFHDTGRYVYSNVPKHIYDGLMMAGSKGAYMHNTVKGRYEHKRV